MVSFTNWNYPIWADERTSEQLVKYGFRKELIRLHASNIPRDVPWRQWDFRAYIHPITHERLKGRIPPSAWVHREFLVIGIISYKGEMGETATNEVLKLPLI